MRLLCLDFESTGLKTDTDRIIEIGSVLWDTDSHRPLYIKGEYAWQKEVEISKEITALTGITNEQIEEFGRPTALILDELDTFCSRHTISRLVMHNGHSFDLPLLKAELNRYGVTAEYLLRLPLLDTRTDLPLQYAPDSMKLKYLATDHGFINPFAHRAVFDCLTTLKILMCYPIEEVIKLSLEPWVMLRALVSYEDRQKAKDRKFLWEVAGDLRFPKQWVKRVRESQVEAERLAATFEIGVLNGKS